MEANPAADALAPVQAAPGQKAERTAGKRIHFAGFTGVRAILSLVMLVYHIEIVKHALGLPSRLHVPFVDNCGQEAVTCFFVLSGFLITYLLFEELARTGTIAVRDFYLRRILRLWPLYYAVLLLGFLVWPFLWPFNQSEMTQLVDASAQTYAVHGALFVTMLANVVYVLPNLSYFTTHIWSIGVEEQFYLFWPWLVLKAKNYVVACLAIIGCYLALKLGVILIKRTYTAGTTEYELWQSIFQFISITRIDCMAIGGLAAWWFRFHKQRWAWLASPGMVWGALGVTFGMLIFRWYVPYVQHELKAVCFAIVFMGMASRPQNFAWLEHRVIRYLGSLGYGFYMLHTLAIGFTLLVIKMYLVPRLGWSYGLDALAYVAATALSFGLAALSFTYLESYFMRFKERFARVKSAV